MSLHGDCPVCGNRPIKPTFKEFVINVALPTQPQHPIGGLRAYQCEKELHVFFVMAKDVDELAETTGPGEFLAEQAHVAARTGG